MLRGRAPRGGGVTGGLPSPDPESPADVAGTWDPPCNWCRKWEGQCWRTRPLPCGVRRYCRWAELTGGHLLASAWGEKPTRLGSSAGREWGAAEGGAANGFFLHILQCPSPGLPHSLRGVSNYGAAAEGGGQAQSREDEGPGFRSKPCTGSDSLRVGTRGNCVPRCTGGWTRNVLYSSFLKPKTGRTQSPPERKGLKWGFTQAMNTQEQEHERPC